MVRTRESKKEFGRGKQEKEVQRVKGKPREVEEREVGRMQKRRFQEFGRRA